MIGLTRTTRHGGLLHHLHGAVTTLLRLISHGLRP